MKDRIIRIYDKIHHLDEFYYKFFSEIKIKNFRIVVQQCLKGQVYILFVLSYIFYLLNNSSYHSRTNKGHDIPTSNKPLCNA